MDSVKGKKKHTSYMEVEKLSLCIEEKKRGCRLGFFTQFNTSKISMEVQI